MTEPRTDASATPLPRRRGGGFIESAVPTPPPPPLPRGGRHRADVPELDEPVAAAPLLAPEPTSPAPAVEQPVPAPRTAATVAPPAERRDAQPPTGDFYGPATSRPTFNPGNASPFQVPRTEAVPRRVSRHPVKTLTTWAAVLVALAIGAKYGYPVVMEQVHAKEIAAVTADLTTIGAAQEAYLKVNGAYATNVDALGVPQTVSRITVVSATGSGYCLKGVSVTGGIARYSSPSRGISETPCG
ncbi:hypothetical protein ACFEMC_09065 [Kineococcus sp. DHX-1]|uniref:hypothetical protein n=1 Tax=Kineococcus sp. DHX-1 TaxID=3349638 RepID=UPI0036D2EBA8